MEAFLCLDLRDDLVDLGDDVFVGGGFGFGDAVDARDSEGGGVFAAVGCKPSV